MKFEMERQGLDSNGQVSNGMAAMERPGAMRTGSRWKAPDGGGRNGQVGIAADRSGSVRIAMAAMGRSGEGRNERDRDGMARNGSEGLARRGPEQIGADRKGSNGKVRAGSARSGLEWIGRKGLVRIVRRGKEWTGGNKFLAGVTLITPANSKNN